MEIVGREAVKEWEQYDIRRGIAPATLTLETLIVPLMTRSRGGAPVVEVPNLVEHLGGSSCKRSMHILMKITRHISTQ